MLEEHGHEVIRYTVSNDEFDKADAAGKLAATFGMLWSFKNYRAVVSLIREHHPDLVHVHTFSRCCPRQFCMQQNVWVCR